MLTHPFLEVETYMKPTNETTSKVYAWLSENCIQATAISPARDWLSVQMSVSLANDIFDADFSVFTHSVTEKQTIRTLTYSVPTDLADHLSLVHPTVS